jgi:hypothetical protein
MGSVKAPLYFYFMKATDIIGIIVFGIPILLWAYHRIVFLKYPPYAKFENYLWRRNLSWLLLVEEFVIWIVCIVVICLFFYVCFNI